MSISPDDLAGLEAAARAASRHAYSPYSGYAVGAAVLTGTGRVFAAGNVENASYSLSSCAERNAVFQAVAAGERSVRALVLYTPTRLPGAPCGACRQVLHEFARDASVHACCDSEARCSWQLAELLPHAFGPETLDGRR